jgi:hypothetical protein
MTEAEWQGCNEPGLMVRFVLRSAGHRHRKLRLFAVTCCQRLSRYLKDPLPKVLDAAERYAEGQIKDRTAQSWYNKAAKAATACGAPFMTEAIGRPELIVYQAVMATVQPRRYGAFLSVHEYVARACGDAMGHRRDDSLWQDARDNEAALLSDLLRDIVNPFWKGTVAPFWLTWNNATVVRIVKAIYDERAFDRMPILADALEDAGCDNADILNHCRGPGPHVRGCWVVDLLLGKQ